MDTWTAFPVHADDLNPAPRTGVAHVYGMAATASLVLLYLCVPRL